MKNVRAHLTYTSSIEERNRYTEMLEEAFPREHWSVVVVIVFTNDILRSLFARNTLKILIVARNRRCSGPVFVNSDGVGRRLNQLFSRNIRKPWSRVIFRTCPTDQPRVFHFLYRVFARFVALPRPYIYVHPAAEPSFPSSRFTNPFVWTHYYPSRFHLAAREIYYYRSRVNFVTNRRRYRSSSIWPPPLRFRLRSFSRKKRKFVARQFSKA